MSMSDVASMSPEASTSEVQYDGLTFVSHMIAGSLAGMMEHTAMYPVDTIKTRMQALSHPGQRLHSASVYKAIKSALKREGVRGLYKGVTAVAAGAGPAHALHFAVYEYAKEALGGNEEGHHMLATGTAGALATILNDAVMNPCDVIKQRLQVTHSPYTGILDCTRKVLAQEGLGAFYKSYRTTLVMNVPFVALHFSVYESAKKVLMEAEDSEDTLPVQLGAGGLAGGIAAGLTNPLDVVKTRLQTDGVTNPSKYDSKVMATMRRIVDEEGMAALWRGFKPRVLFHVPAAAVCWGTYESIKSFLGAS